MQRILHIAGIGEWQAGLLGKAAVLRGVTFFVLLCIQSLSTHGQTYFDELFGDVPNGQGIGRNGTIQYGDGYLSLGASFGNMKPYLLYAEADGMLIHDMFLEFPDSVSYQCVQLEQLSDSVFIGRCFRKETWQPSSQQGDYNLIRFKVDGSVLSEWNYGYPDRIDAPQHFVSTDDGGFLISGQTQFEVAQNMDGQLYCVKIDSQGNLEWSQEYGGSLYESGGSGIQTPDGGFLLLGWTRSFGVGQRDFYLVKTDSQGNEQWYEAYGGPGEDVGSSLLKLLNGNYLLTGGGTNAAVTTAKGFLYEVTPTGQEVWHQEYASGPSEGDHLFKSLQLSDGSIVSCGLADNDQTGGNAGWLIKTNPNGDLLWQRVYDKNQYTDLFYSLLETDDGGFLLSGQAINEQTNSQDAWLLKVDSVGCTFPNCITGIDQAEKTVVVDVWPNPATDVLNVEKVSSSKQLDISVFDLSGRSVPLSKGVAGTAQLSRRGIHTFDVSHWKSGIYVLQGIDEEGRSFSLKVVKQ